MPGEWPSNPPLRGWQKRAFHQYLNHDRPDFLTVATPGAGKTMFALRVAHESLRIRRVGRIIVVTPTEHLKTQWAKAAAKVGIHLDPTWQNDGGSPAIDYHGLVVSYGQIASNPDVHRWLCREPTLAVFDEIHHAGEEKPWGSAIRSAYEPAVRRLLLSGTPFRSDDVPIPFVRYEDGKSRADFSYSYGDALRDGWCRPVLFPSFEGDMKWYSRGRSHEATFRDDVNETLAAQRLRTALEPSGGWIPEVIRSADAELTRLRETHPEAGGLIVAMKTEHADAIAKQVARITGEFPLVATHDDPHASDVINEFDRGRRRWIVAIKMVSEGVDIPRLRVGVYATNTLTEMFFRQVVGRFVRMIDGIEDQNAYLFIPRDERLVGFAQQIKEERDHQLEEEIRAAREASAGLDERTDDKIISPFIAISATGRPDDVFFDQDAFTQAELSEAERFRSEAGVPASFDSVMVAKIARLVRKTVVTTVHVETTAEPVSPPPPTLQEQKKTLRRIIGRLVSRIREMSDGALNHQEIYTRLMKRDNADQGHATIAQLEARIEFLEQWIKAYPDVR